MKKIFIVICLSFLSTPVVCVSGVGPKLNPVFNYVKDNKWDLEKIWKTPSVQLDKIREVAKNEALNIVERQQLLFFLSQHERVNVWLNLSFVKRQKMSEKEKIQIIQKTDNESETPSMVNLFVEIMAKGSTVGSGLNRPFLFSWSFVRFLYLHLVQTFHSDELCSVKSLQKSVFYQLGLKMGFVLEEDLINEIKNLEDNNGTDFLWLSRPIYYGTVGHFYEVKFTKVDRIISMTKFDSQMAIYQFKDDLSLKSVVLNLIPWEKMPSSQFDSNLPLKTGLYTPTTPVINILGMGCWINGKMVFLTNLFPHLEILMQSYLFHVSKKYIKNNSKLRISLQKVVNQYNTPEKLVRSPLLTDALGRPYLFYKVMLGKNIRPEKIYSFLPDIVKKIIRGDLIAKKDDIDKIYDQEDLYGLLPIHWAVAKGDKDIFKYVLNSSIITSDAIIKNGVLDLINESKNDYLFEIIRPKIDFYQLFKFYLAGKNISEISKFIVNNRSFNYNIADELNISLWQRIFSSSILGDIIFEFVRNNIPLDINLLHRDMENKNILHYLFVGESHQNIKHEYIKEYIKNKDFLKTLINQKDKYNKTPIYYAIDSTWKDIVCDKEIAKAIDVNIPNTSIHNTLLHRTAQENNLTGLTCLLNHPNININIRNKYQVTPLHLASAKGNRNIVEKLINSGADISLKAMIEGEEMDAFRFAIKEGKYDLANYLLKKMVDTGNIDLFVNSYIWAKSNSTLAELWDKIYTNLFQNTLKYTLQYNLSYQKKDIVKAFLEKIPVELIVEKNENDIHISDDFLKIFKDKEGFACIFNKIKDQLNEKSIIDVMAQYIDIDYQIVVDYLTEKYVQNDIPFDLIQKMVSLNYKTSLKNISNSIGRLNGEQKRELLLLAMDKDINDKELYVIIDGNLEYSSVSQIVIANGTLNQIGRYLEFKLKDPNYKLSMYKEDYLLAKKSAYSLSLFDIDDLFKEKYSDVLLKMTSLDLSEYKKEYNEFLDEIRDTNTFLLKYICSFDDKEKFEFIYALEKEKISDENLTVYFEKYLECGTERDIKFYLDLLDRYRKNIKWSFELFKNVINHGYFDILKGKEHLPAFLFFDKNQKDELLCILVSKYPQQEKWIDLLLPQSLDKEGKKDYLRAVTVGAQYVLTEKIDSSDTLSIVPIKDEYYILNNDQMMKYSSSNRLIWNQDRFPPHVAMNRIKNRQFIFEKGMPHSVLVLPCTIENSSGCLIDCKSGDFIGRDTFIPDCGIYSSCANNRSFIISGNKTLCLDFSQVRWVHENNQSAKIVYHDRNVVVTVTKKGLVQAFNPHIGPVIWEKNIPESSIINIAPQGLLYVENNYLITLNIDTGEVRTKRCITADKNIYTVRSLNTSHDGKYSIVTTNDYKDKTIYIVNNHSGFNYQFNISKKEYITSIRFIPTTQKFVVLTNPAKDYSEYKWDKYCYTETKMTIYDLQEKGYVSEYTFPTKEYINRIVIGPNLQLAFYFKNTNFDDVVDDRHLYILSEKNYSRPQNMQIIEIPKETKKIYWGTKELDQLYLTDYDHVYIYAPK